MKKQYVNLIIVIVLIIIVISSIILYNQWPLIVGEKIIVNASLREYDDPFYGSYMIINYEFSTIINLEKIDIDDVIYVLLSEDKQGIWRYENTSKYRPLKGLFLRGKVKNINYNKTEIEYGIEQFFFEKNAKMPTKNTTVKISVAKSGRAKLEQIFFNGEPIKINYK